MQVIIIGQDRGQNYLDLVEFCSIRGIKLVEEKITSTNKQIMPLPPSCGECPYQRACKQHGGMPYAYGGLECLNIRRAATA